MKAKGSESETSQSFVHTARDVKKQTLDVTTGKMRHQGWTRFDDVLWVVSIDSTNGK
jgi:hypothetical protein